MFNSKAKKILLPLLLSVVTALLTPAIAQAELGGSGSSAARDAAEQKAAKERKLEKKRQAAEAKKAVEAQQGQPAEEAQQGQPTAAETPVVEPAEKPAAQ